MTNSLSILIIYREVIGCFDKDNKIHFKDKEGKFYYQQVFHINYIFNEGNMNAFKYLEILKEVIKEIKLKLAIMKYC